jgi:hypothetical protein
MVRQKLVDAVEEVNFATIRLKHLFELTVEDAIRFLVNVGVMKNEMSCDECGSKMNVQKRSKQADGIWVRINF